jgi:ANTAR domain/GAF domain
MTTDSGYQDSIRLAMDALSRDFSSGVSVDDALDRITATAVDLVDGVDYADVMLIENGGFRSMAPTDPVVSLLDEAQMRLNEGPCLDAATTDSIIHTGDLRTGAMWPRFAQVAVDVGVLGVLSIQLFTFKGGVGALNLLSRRPDAVDPEGEALAAVLATHAAVVLMAASRRQQYESALASRDLIGQAKGILMGQFSIDAVRAFDLIVKQSQNTNTPVRTVAAQIIDSYVPRRAQD